MDHNYRSQPSKFALSGDAPNPLRPYYVPPSVGPPVNSPTIGPNTTSQPGLSNASKSSTSSTRPSFGTAARNILSDIDYGDYLKTPSSSSAPSSSSSLSSSSSSVAEAAKRLADQAIWKYTSVFLAQPFDVAKTILQCQHSGAVLRATGKSSYAQEITGGRFEGSEFGGNRETYGYASDEDSDLGSPSYFTSAAPSQSYSIKSPSKSRHRHDPYPEADISTSSSRDRNNARHHHRQHQSSQQDPSLPPYKLELYRFGSITEVLAQVWSKEGVWGLWKGTNATFIYGILFRTIETWARGLLSAVLNLPDPTLTSVSAGADALGSSMGVGGLNMVESGSPMASLAIVVAASGIAGFLLAPLDVVRTRLILTPLNYQPRSVIPSLRCLQTYTCPFKIAPITLLHSIIPTFFSASTPLILRSTFRIDPVLTPTTYSIATFLSSVMELFVRLPCETILRRGQIATARDSYTKQQQEQQQQQQARQNLNHHNQSSDRNERYSARRMHSSQRIPYVVDNDQLPPSPSPSPSQPRSSSPSMMLSTMKTAEPYSLPTIISTGPYNGIFGTVWTILREERSSDMSSSLGRERGQPSARRLKDDDKDVAGGLQFMGLWRGWRVGFWGLVGVWGAAACGGGGAEF